ncbi:MAG: hypothetical protein LC804_26355 [Acidobacteria bacterium]|nr:hypothetical protein [Acidobacteriota bacterium]
MSAAPPLLTAEIIAVGSELLSTSRMDTNSLLITEGLNEIGIEVRVKHVVGDHRGDLATMFADDQSAASDGPLRGGGAREFPRHRSGVVDGRGRQGHRSAPRPPT